MANTVYTVGHSTYSIERFLKLLKEAGIEVVGDVRSRPYSRMNSRFNREPLRDALAQQGIKYVFLGKELGARSEDKSVYVNGQAKYELIAQTALFERGIDRVIEGAEKYRIALMCAEKEPLECHRTILVSRRLKERGLNIGHILSDGAIESHEHVLERLISKLGIIGEDMFRPHDEVVAEAYAKQGKEVAYQEANDGNQLDNHPLGTGRRAQA